MFFHYLLDYKFFGLLKRAVQADAETGDLYWAGPWRFRMETAWQDLFLASLDEISELFAKIEQDDTPI